MCIGALGLPNNWIRWYRKFEVSSVLAVGRSTKALQKEHQLYKNGIIFVTDMTRAISNACGGTIEKGEDGPTSTSAPRFRVQGSCRGKRRASKKTRSALRARHVRGAAPVDLK